MGKRSRLHDIICACCGWKGKSHYNYYCGNCAWYRLQGMKCDHSAAAFAECEGKRAEKIKTTELAKIMEELRQSNKRA